MRTLRGEYLTEMTIPVKVRFTVEPADPGDRITPPSGPVVTITAVEATDGTTIKTHKSQRWTLADEIEERIRSGDIDAE